MGNERADGFRGVLWHGQSATVTAHEGLSNRRAASGKNAFHEETGARHELHATTRLSIRMSRGTDILLRRMLARHHYQDCPPQHAEYCSQPSSVWQQSHCSRNDIGAMVEFKNGADNSNPANDTTSRTQQGAKEKRVRKPQPRTCLGIQSHEMILIQPGRGGSGPDMQSGGARKIQSRNRAGGLPRAIDQKMTMNACNIHPSTIAGTASSRTARPTITRTSSVVSQMYSPQIRIPSNSPVLAPFHVAPVSGSANPIATKRQPAIIPQRR